MGSFYSPTTTDLEYEWRRRNVLDPLRDLQTDRQCKLCHN